MKTITINDAVASHIRKASETASYLWQREWAERNGGNISIDISNIIGELPESFEGFRYVEVNNFPKKAAGKVLFVSGTGERLRELSNPENSACIIHFNSDAAGYHILWGGLSNQNFRPTSELITHIKIHIDNEETGSNHSTVLHTHPIELICLTHHPKFANDEKAFTNACWKMLPEVRAFCPKGIGLIPYIIPGSEKLADHTVESLRTNDVAIWCKHGAVATGKDALEAFDFIDVANKGAKLYLKCLASGFEPLGMTQDEINELVSVFNL
jgi:rhamnulose-1-phosphate aldolase